MRPLGNQRRGIRRRGATRGGFTLLELLLTLVIISTALVALGASVSTGISSAADSINQRAAREVCRAKLEEAVANGQTTGGGGVDNYPSFQWNLTSEEKTTGAADSPTEKYIVLTVTVTFPQDQPSTSGTSGQSSSSQNQSGGSISLVTAVDPPDLEKGTPANTTNNGSNKNGGR